METLFQMLCVVSMTSPMVSRFTAKLCCNFTVLAVLGILSGMVD